MTLRCTLEIIPFGEEKNKEELFRFDISNIEFIRNLGFGNEICKYNVRVWRKNNQTMQNLLKYDEYTLEREFDIPEHNRRDGAIELVRKVAEIYEKR